MQYNAASKPTQFDDLDFRNQPSRLTLKWMTEGKPLSRKLKAKKAIQTAIHMTKLKEVTYVQLIHDGIIIAEWYR